MQRVELKATQRKEIKKSVNNQLRREGFVPAVVYHRGDDSAAIAVGERELRTALHTDAGRNALIDLQIEGANNRTVVVKDMQVNPVTGNALHVDFHEISMEEKITVEVTIRTKGEPIGVKSEGGILEFPTREIQVECLPTQIPEHIDINIDNLGLNDAIHIKDLVLPDGVVAIDDLEQVIIHVVPPHVEEAPEEGAEASAEPEVIGEKKDDEEGAEAPASAPKEDKSEQKK